MSRDNNFNLLRVVAALMVLASHTFAIVTGEPQSEPLVSTLGVSLGSISVDVFFACSGFLVCASYFRRNSIFQFARARALRIFPALIVMLLISISFLGCTVSQIDLLNFYSNPQTLNYFFKNSFLFFGAEYLLPNVFENNPYYDVVNGSLWTLPHEARAYLLLAIVCWFAHRFLTFEIIRLVFGLLSIVILCLDSSSEWFGVRLPHFHFVHLFGIFLSGATLYLYQVHLSKYMIYMCFIAVCVMAATIYLDTFKYFYVFLIPIISLGIAYLPVSLLRSYNRVGDYSYGIYLYAFPIQQTIVFYYPSFDVFQVFCLAFVFSLICALLSWNLVEKRFLALK